MHCDVNKNRTGVGVGESFLKIRAKDENISLNKLSPFVIQKTIDSFCGPVKSLKKIRDGSILIKTKNFTQSQKLLTLNKLGEIEISVQKDERLNSSKGVCFSIEAGFCTESELLDNLKDQKVIEIKRFIRRDGKMTNMYFITFGLATPPPNIFIGYENCKIELYIPNPLRCFKCLKFGHTKTKCTATNEICMNCGDNVHTTNIDPNTKRCLNESKCINCHGNHSSMSKTCPMFIKEKEIVLIKTRENISYIDARKKFYELNPIQKGPSFSQIVKKANCNCPCNCQQTPVQTIFSSIEKFKSPATINRPTPNFSAQPRLTLAKNLPDVQQRITDSDTDMNDTNSQASTSTSRTANKRKEPTPSPHPSTSSHSQNPPNSSQLSPQLQRKKKKKHQKEQEENIQINFK